MFLIFYLWLAFFIDELHFFVFDYFFFDDLYFFLSIYCIVYVLQFFVDELILLLESLLSGLFIPPDPFTENSIFYPILSDSYRKALLFASS